MQTEQLLDVVLALQVRLRPDVGEQRQPDVYRNRRTRALASRRSRWQRSWSVTGRRTLSAGELLDETDPGGLLLVLEAGGPGEGYVLLVQCAVEVGPGLGEGDDDGLEAL